MRLWCQQGCAGMKSKTGQVRAREGGAGEKKMSGDEQVRSEIQTFIRALESYPERFADNPRVTFEEYRSSLAQTSNLEPRRS